MRVPLMVRRVGMVAIAATAMVALYVVPAQAATYDGVNPVGSSGWASHRLVASDHLGYNGGAPNSRLPIIDLWYSSCRTTWAQLEHDVGVASYAFGEAAGSYIAYGWTSNY